MANQLCLLIKLHIYISGIFTFICPALFITLLNPLLEGLENILQSLWPPTSLLLCGPPRGAGGAGQVVPPHLPCSFVGLVLVLWRIFSTR